MENDASIETLDHFEFQTDDETWISGGDIRREPRALLITYRGHW